MGLLPPYPPPGLSWDRWALGTVRQTWSCGSLGLLAQHGAGQDESQQLRASGVNLGQIRCASRSRCGGHKTAYLVAQLPKNRQQEDSLGGPWLEVGAARWVLTAPGTGGGASGLQPSPMEGSWGAEWWWAAVDTCMCAGVMGLLLVQDRIGVP